MQDHKRFIEDVMKTWDVRKTGELQLDELQVKLTRNYLSVSQQPLQQTKKKRTARFYLAWSTRGNRL